MREFVVTPEMKADAKADRREMMRLRDEMERAGFVFKDVDSFELVFPREEISRPDGTSIFRQWQRN